MAASKFWVAYHSDGSDFFAGPFQPRKFKAFLPAGPTDDGSGHFTGFRKQSLVAVYTDYGLRTATVGSIWVKDPKKYSNPW